MSREPRSLGEILGEVAAGRLAPAEALGLVAGAHALDLGFASVDLSRGCRQTLPEVILGSGKLPEEMLAIFRSLLERTGFAIASRLPHESARLLLSSIPDGRHGERARCFAAGRGPSAPGGEGVVAVVTAGTSDLPAAEEAAFVLEEMSVAVERVFDVGVAGLHRLGRSVGGLSSASVAIVCAGMDGALPSVVGGLLPVPVIAVPTSTGYGTSFGGISALLAALNSCSPGVCVMNIDNGLGAAAAALRILRGKPAPKPS